MYNREVNAQNALLIVNSHFSIPHRDEEESLTPTRHNHKPNQQSKITPQEQWQR